MSVMDMPMVGGLDARSRGRAMRVASGTMANLNAVRPDARRDIATDACSLTGSEATRDS
jgi:hypothetical protein